MSCRPSGLSGFGFHADARRLRKAPKTESRTPLKGAVAERRRRANSLLGKGGVAAPSGKRPRSFEGADGVVRSSPNNNRLLERTTLLGPVRKGADLAGLPEPVSLPS
jgi:hypothetical protein